MIPRLLYERNLAGVIGKKLKKECVSNLNFIKRFGLRDTYTCHDGCVNAIQFNRTGEHVLSGSDDTCICITDLVLGKTILTHRTRHLSNIFQTKYVPSKDNEIISAARDGLIRHYHVSPSHVTEREIARHSGSTHKLTFSNSANVLSAGEDGCVIQTDLRTDNSTTIVEHDSALYSIDSDSGNYFIISGVSSSTWLHDIRSPSTPALTFNPVGDESADVDELDPQTGTCSRFNFDGSAFLVSYNNNTIYLFDTHDNSEYQHKYTGHRNNDTVKGVNFYGLDSEYVMSGSDCGHIFMWDTKSEEIVQCLVGEEDGIVNSIEFNAHGPMIASSGLEHSVKIWTPNCEELCDLADLEEIKEKNLTSQSLNRDVLTIFLSRMNNEEVQSNCRQS